MLRPLPARVASFVPTEGADPFFTSYGDGPVFGASCAYASGARQVIVRVESGNIRARANAALDPRGEAGTDTRFQSHAIKVHGRPALQRYSGIGEVGEGGELWRQVVGRIGKDGWLGIGWPKEFGGQGRPATDQFIFFDETRRAGALRTRLAPACGRE